MRVGVVDYANALPLADGLERHLPGAVVVRTTPAAISDGLHSGSLDVGLVPVASLPGHPRWAVTPGLGIASRGRVDSVLLLSQVPPDRITRIVLDPASRTSNLLARLWLRMRQGADPEVLSGPPDAGDRLEGGDATVAIGDDALFFAGRAEWRIDLGEAWTEWTGLPFVFAVWAGPRGDAPELAPAFLACYRENALKLEELASRAAGEDVGRRERLISYLTNCVRYRLGAEESEGLARFFTLGAQAGYLPHISEGTPHVHVA